MFANQSPLSLSLPMAKCHFQVMTKILITHPFWGSRVRDNIPQSYSDMVKLILKMYFEEFVGNRIELVLIFKWSSKPNLNIEMKFLKHSKCKI